MQFAQADADADGRVTQSELQAMPSPRAELLAALAVWPPDRAARVKSLRERAIAARLAKHRVAAEAASAAGSGAAAALAGWKYEAALGVCAHSALAMGGCLASATWAAAKARCSEHGVRLCSLAELPQPALLGGSSRYRSAR